MVRLRKEKGQSAVQNPGPNKDRKSKSKNGKKVDTGISKDQLLALGGDEEDMELLKDLDENEVVSGAHNADVIILFFINLFFSC